MLWQLGFYQTFLIAIDLFTPPPFRLITVKKRAKKKPARPVLPTSSVRPPISSGTNAMNFSLYANNNGSMNFFNFFFNFLPRPMAKAVDVNDLAEFCALAIGVACVDAVTAVNRGITGAVTVCHTNAAAIGAMVVAIAVGGLR